MRLRAMAMGRRPRRAKVLRLGLGVGLGVGHHAIAGGSQGHAAPGGEEAGAAGQPALRATPRARIAAGARGRGGSWLQGPGRQRERPGCRRQRCEPACGLEYRVARKGLGAWLGRQVMHENAILTRHTARRVC